MIINLLKNLNANYDLLSHIHLIETFLKTEVAKVNARVDRIIERNKNFTIGKYFTTNIICIVKLNIYFIYLNNYFLAIDRWTDPNNNLFRVLC